MSTIFYNTKTSEFSYNHDTALAWFNRGNGSSIKIHRWNDRTKTWEYTAEWVANSSL